MSDLLFSTPSWLSGAARTLDIASVFDDYSFGLTPAQTDWLALASDTDAVAKDFWIAVHKFESEQAHRCNERRFKEVLSRAYMNRSEFRTALRAARAEQAVSAGDAAGNEEFSLAR